MYTKFDLHKLNGMISFRNNDRGHPILQVWNATQTALISWKTLAVAGKQLNRIRLPMCHFHCVVFTICLHFLKTWLTPRKLLKIIQAIQIGTSPVTSCISYNYRKVRSRYCRTTDDFYYFHWYFRTKMFLDFKSWRRENIALYTRIRLFRSYNEMKSISKLCWPALVAV